jgi:hypothetical protein
MQAEITKLPNVSTTGYLYVDESGTIFVESGAIGGGGGDMFKSAYDLNDDGIVTFAETGHYWGTGVYAYTIPSTGDLYGLSGNVLQTNGDGTTFWVPAYGGTGDMGKDTYDANDDGVVDYAYTGVFWGSGLVGFMYPNYSGWNSYGDSGCVLGTNGDGTTSWIGFIPVGGTTGQVLTSDGLGGSYWSSAGAGDMMKATYDSDDNGAVSTASSGILWINANSTYGWFAPFEGGFGYGTSGSVLSNNGDSSTAWVEIANVITGYFDKATYDADSDNRLDVATTGLVWAYNPTGFGYSAPNEDSYGTSGFNLQNNGDGSTAWVPNAATGFYNIGNAVYVWSFPMESDYGTSGFILQNNGDSTTAWVKSLSPADYGTSGQVLLTDGGGNTDWVDPPTPNKGDFGIFLPRDYFPGTEPCTSGVVGSQLKRYLGFESGVSQTALFEGVCPYWYSGQDVLADLRYVLDTPNDSSNSVHWNILIARLTANGSINGNISSGLYFSESHPNVDGTGTISQAAGSFTNGDFVGITGGDPYQLFLERIVGEGSFDNVSGDVQFLSLRLYVE